MIRTLWRWHRVGCVSAVVLTVLCAKIGWPADDVMTSALNALFFLVCGTPTELAFLRGWTLIAARWPAVEHQVVLRIALLGLTAIFTTLVALTFVSAWLTWREGGPFSVNEVLGPFRTNASEMGFLCALFAAWAILPRLLVPSLRAPILLGTHGARNTAAI